MGLTQQLQLAPIGTGRYFFHSDTLGVVASGDHRKDPVRAGESLQLYLAPGVKGEFAGALQQFPDH